jgi:hypothetical protein
MVQKKQIVISVDQAHVFNNLLDFLIPSTIEVLHDTTFVLPL